MIYMAGLEPGPNPGPSGVRGWGWGWASVGTSLFYESTLEATGFMEARERNQEVKWCKHLIGVFTVHL